MTASSAPRSVIHRLALALLVVALCRPADADDDAATLIGRLLDSATHPYLRWSRFVDRQLDVRRLYESVAFHPLWIHDQRPTRQADVAIAVLSDADTRGLDAVDYDTARLRAEAARLGRRAPPEDVALFDTALTIAVMRYASDAYVGRVLPARLGFVPDDEPKRLDLPSFVAELAQSDDPAEQLAALDPPVPMFTRFREALAETRALAARTDLPEIPEDVPTLHPGDRHAAVAALRHRLVALGDLDDTTSATDESIYDRELAAAVKRFQERHGRGIDGILGSVTLHDLRVPLGARAQQIALAMERLRWSPREITGRFLVVNVPEFRLRGFEGDDPTPKVSMDVVVGSAARRTQTPVVHGHMSWVAFRPYWDVPRSIARKEILPRAARDPTYLGRENMEFVGSRLRQRPGPNNALGLLKFVFPNRFDVYLHDTPQKEYFLRTRRDFSHGCIRVADAVALAEFVLGWDRARITAAMTEGSDNHRVQLAEPVAVYVLYTTAAVEDGRIFFFDDIYGYDAALARALENRYTEPLP